MVMLLAGAVLGAGDANACVGKTLQVGVVARSEEKMLTSLLSIMVNERTGTSIKVREFPTFRECFTALEKNDIDVAVVFMGQGAAEILGQGGEFPPTIPEEIKNAFNQRFNLIWLEPWGLTDQGRHLKDRQGQVVTTQVAPLVRKETLKEFPALARLINKMAGRLDGERMQALLKKADGGRADAAAREYLKAEKLI
jgi:osmoprotectant transport system substrate-binding protein